MGRDTTIGWAGRPAPGWKARTHFFAGAFLLLPLVLAAGCEEAPEDPDAPAMEDDALDEGPRPPRGMAWVIFDGDTVRAEVAATPEARQRGLQFREELAPGHGMLFVFEEAQPQAFWMEDTYIALDIAYLDQRQRIVDIQQMEPLSDELYESAAPAMFALEVPQGWFEEHGISVGDEAAIVFGPAS